MKALIVSAAGQFAVQEMPRPIPGPYDCLVKIDACAICTGTDTHIIDGSFPWLSPYPFVLGHESTGVILETGEKVRNFLPGQRVTRPAAVLSGTSYHGFNSNWGGYAEYGLVRDVSAAAADGQAPDGMQSISRTPLPEGVGPVNGALSINQREILSVTRRIPLDSGSAVTVIGSGYNGLLFSLFCKHFGAGRLVMAGNPRLAGRAMQGFDADALLDYRQPQVARQVKETLGGDPTHVIDAVGSQASLRLAEALLSPGAAFGCYGIDDFSQTEAKRASLAERFIPLDMGTDEPNTVDAWYDLWKTGFFNRPGMLDALMPLEQAHEAFGLLARREAVKIVLKIN